MRCLAGILVACSFLGCAEPSDRAIEIGTVASRQFFENSLRRDATPAEAARVAMMGTRGCAAFFLENTQGKVYLATARHCVRWNLTAWCENDGRVVDNAGVEGRCTRIAAGDAERDVAVFEADMAHASGGSTTLRLTSYVPAENTRLVMTGYPADADPETARGGKLTTTVDCWTLGSTVESPQKNDPVRTFDVSLRHNCSTYGGNSGGPMYIEGTRDAIGLPYTYVPNDYTRRSATDLETAAHLALTADLADAQRAALESAGISISDAPVAEPTPVVATTEAEADERERVPTEEARPAPSSAAEAIEKRTPKRARLDVEDDASASGCSATGRSADGAGGAAFLVLALFVISRGLLSSAGRASARKSRTP